MNAITGISSQQTQSHNTSTSSASKKLLSLLVAPLVMSQNNLVTASSTGSNLRATTESSRLLNTGTDNNNRENVSQGKLDCPCIPINATTLEFSKKYDADRDCLYFSEPGQTYCYPTNYGFDGCQAYDENLPPSCNQEGFPGNPDWCAKSFCYIDPDNCVNTDHYPSTYFKEEGLHYSYKTCGSKNTFIGMINDKLDSSFMELAAVLERYVVGFRFTLENSYDKVKTFSDSSSSQSKECGYSDSCGPVLEGSFENCWGDEVDFNNVNVVLHPNRANQASSEEVNTLACLSQTIKSSFLNVAETEHDDSNRVGYIYYGDQDTGGLVVYPEQPFCSSSFDARFRPWYASAVSGPKDVVVVVDTSGSMEGNRIRLARQAAEAVIDTLTWADRISLVTFTDNVDSNDVYSTTLVPSNEANIKRMKRWVGDHFRAGGGTNFMKPLAKAYELLNKNKDANDQQSCSQAILFLTDGQADFNRGQMQQMVDNNPNAVVFSYGLSDGAQQNALQQMACMTGGIFHPVRNEVELPRMMSSYYEYYAKLQDNGKLSWLKYTDAVTKEEIVSGCTPIFNYGNNGLVEPDLVGVACMDLNVIIDLDTLKTCDGGAFDQFIEHVFREAIRCPSAQSKVDDECVLQNMRARISPAAICPGEENPETCDVGPQRTETDFSQLNPARFEVIPLDGCSTLNSTCEKPLDRNPPTSEAHRLNIAPALLAAAGTIGGMMWT